MIACPDCGAELPDLAAPSCAGCGRRFGSIAGVPELLATADLETPIFAAYREHYERLAGDDLNSSVQPEDHHRIETQRLTAVLGDLTDLDICDVGAGRGVLLESLKESGARTITGVDLAAPYLRRLSGESRFRLVLASAERLPFRAEFDVVVAADVLEHVLNPGDCLISIHRALRPGGRFVVRVPYRDNLVAYATHAGYRYSFVHLRAFDRRGLRELLSHAGFRVQASTFSGFYATKLRGAFSRVPQIERRVRVALESRFGSPGAVTLINRRLGLLLMRPNTLTVVAVRRAQ